MFCNTEQKLRSAYTSKLKTKLHFMIDVKVNCIIFSSFLSSLIVLVVIYLLRIGSAFPWSLDLYVVGLQKKRYELMYHGVR